MANSTHIQALLEGRKEARKAKSLEERKVMALEHISDDLLSSADSLDKLNQLLSQIEYHLRHS